MCIGSSCDSPSMLDMHVHVYFFCTYSYVYIVTQIIIRAKLM